MKDRETPLDQISLILSAAEYCKQNTFAVDLFAWISREIYVNNLDISLIGEHSNLKNVIFCRHRFLFITSSFSLTLSVLHCSLTLETLSCLFLNFHPIEVVSRYRDPQLQVSENYPYLFNSSANILKSWCLNTHFVSNKSALSDNKTVKKLFLSCLAF